MATTVEQIDYKSLKDAEVVSLCVDRGIAVPYNSEGRVIRNEALRLLREKDKEARANEADNRVWVVFHHSGNPSAGPYVFASVNGKNLQAPYEKEVCIPKYFLTECIDRAHTTQRKYQLQSDGTTASIVTKIPTYPYTVLREATPEDMETYPEPSND